MRTNDNIHLMEQLDELTFPIEYKDEIKKIYKLGFEKGRAYIPRSDLIKGWVCAAIVVFLIVVITYNIARNPASSATETISSTHTALTSADINTIACLIQEYEGQGKKLSEYRKIIIVSELLNAPQSEWSKIVKKIGDEAPTSANNQRVQSTSFGGKPN